MLQDTKEKVFLTKATDISIFTGVPTRTSEIERIKTQSKSLVFSPSPALYLTIFGSWIVALIWFQPRLMELLTIAENWQGALALWTFILFIDFAWLYGFYNMGVVVFAIINRYLPNQVANHPDMTSIAAADIPPVALLYTTCNDFIEKSVFSCVTQDYPNYKVYILDDSSDEEYKRRVDDFAKRFPDKVVVVRRKDRKAFKAGNMNHGLENVAVKEPYFAIADADEILPTDFLSKTVPLMEADPNMGFVQANHRANPDSDSSLSKQLGVGIDIHWKWYQPLRNRFGFVMFLGHGALLRRKCWEEIGGFPDIVSEDLGFAIHAREKGYRGYFAEDIMCFEDFPDTVRSFRVRHMKWTRGTCEFLAKKFTWLMKAKNITWTEKFDILFPTLNLPLTLLYFMFMVNANLILPLFFGHQQELTLAMGGIDFVLPVMVLDAGFNVIYSADFFIITILTFFSPVLCFIIALAHKPIQMMKFLCHSTALYAALSPLSSIGVVAYMISGKAIFLVTGDTAKQGETKLSSKESRWTKFKSAYQTFIRRSHPDHKLVQAFEIFIGLFFSIVCLYMFQISFLGLCFAFILLPLMHHLKWDNKFVKAAVYAPLVLILLGVGLTTLNLVGLQSVFFGYGFHF